MDATYVKAAADNMLLALGISSLSNNFNFFNSFKALLEALNSTGKVINWKTNRASNKIIPISINLYEKIAPITMAR